MPYFLFLASEIFVRTYFPPDASNQCKRKKANMCSNPAGQKEKTKL